ncbi:MAG TPA: hypothetical protein VHA75_08010 [Rugosimonospora sp.]|nr:hypothetical protein [Rugosimonospora sp.]
MTTTTRMPAPRLDVPEENKKTARLVRCRYLTRRGVGRTGLVAVELDQCTAEAVTEDGPIYLCITHLALALELIQERLGTVQ